MLVSRIICAEEIYSHSGSNTGALIVGQLRKPERISPEQLQMVRTKCGDAIADYIESGTYYTSPRENIEKIYDEKIDKATRKNLKYIRLVREKKGNDEAARELKRSGFGLDADTKVNTGLEYARYLREIEGDDSTEKFLADWGYTPGADRD